LYYQRCGVLTTQLIYGGHCIHTGRKNINNKWYNNHVHHFHNTYICCHTYFVLIRYLFEGGFLNWKFGGELRYSNVTEIYINVTDLYGSYRVQTVVFLYCGCEHLSQCGKSKSNTSFLLFVFRWTTNKTTPVCSVLLHIHFCYGLILYGGTFHMTYNQLLKLISFKIIIFFKSVNDNSKS